MQFSVITKKMSTSVAALAAVGAATGTSSAADESFAGLYAGVSLLAGASGFIHNGDSSPDYTIDNVKPGVGGFVGYNWVGGADGRRILGIEFDLGNSEIGANNGDGGTGSDYAATNPAQVKLRYGRSFGGASSASSFGAFMVYGFASYGVQDHGYEGNLDGYGAGRTVGAGIGVEANITDRIAVGLEAQSMLSDHKGYYNYSIGRINTVTFRALMRF